MSKKVLSMFLVLAMVFSMVPTAGFAADKTTINLDVGTEVVTGQEYEFDYIITPVVADINKDVVTVFNFSNAEDIESLSIWDYVSNEWDVLSIESDLYMYIHSLTNLNPSGEIESKIKIKFKDTATAGHYDFTVTLETYENDKIVLGGTLDEQTLHIDVVDALKSSLVTDINGANITAGQWHEFSFTLSGSAADAGKKVVGVSQFSDVDIIEALEYWEVTDSSWKNLLLDTDGAFGSAEGFDMPAADFEATSKFRVKFKETAPVGSYSFTAKMMLMDGTTITSTSLCEVTANFNVLAPEIGLPSTLTTSINGAQVVAGEWYGFDFTLHAKAGDAGKKVVGVSHFSDSDEIEAIEYWVDATGAWGNLMMDGDGNFGAAEGFDMPPVDFEIASLFRVKFKETAKIGPYTFTVELKVVDGTTVTNQIVCSTVASFDVIAPEPSSLSTTINGANITAGEWYEFDFTLHAKASDAGKMVVGKSYFGNEDQIEALEYWETADSSWKNLLGGDGSFGPAAGFPMPNADVDATSKFRVKFKEDAVPGDYSFTAQMVLVGVTDGATAGDVILCYTTANFTVWAPAASRNFESSLSNDLNGDEIVVGEWHEFSFTLDAKAADAGVNVVGVSNFANADEIEAIEYWDDTTSTWNNLMMDGDGNFGANTGFPLPNVDVQVESKFRVKFKEDATLGSHNFTAKLMVVDGATVTDEMVCSTDATFELKAASAPVGESTLTTDINGDAIALDSWHEFTFTLNGSAADAGKKVVGVSQFSDVDIIEALEYWEVTDSSWKNLLLDTDGAFGSAEGFDMPAVNFEATSKFRVKFKHPDTIKDSYSFSVQMKVVDGTTVTDEVLCETTATFTLDHEPIIDMTKWVHDETGHWHGATCSCADKVQFAEHIASDWIIDEEAKVGVKGEKHKECTVCGRVLETAEIPAKSSGGGGSTIRTSNIDVRSDDEEIQYRASIIGNSVTISMSNSELKKIVNKNIDVGMVVIDLTSANKVIEKVTVTNGNLKYLLDSAENTDIEGLTIIFEDGVSIVLNMDAIEYLLDQTSRNVDFSVVEQTERDLNTKQKEAVKNMTVLGYYEAFISAANKNITGFKDGTATVHVDDEIIGEYDFHGLDAYVVDSDGEVSDVRLYYYDDIELVISDVTDYVVVYDANNVIKSCPKNNNCPLHKFMDVNTYGWYHDGIHYAIDNGLMVGYSDTQFGPDDAITRGQIVTILWRLEGSPSVKQSMTFKDVASDAYYAKAVQWAQANGIVGGYNTDTFGPDDNITREQMVTIMHRYAEFKEYKVTTDKSDSLRAFEDYAQISDWAVQSVKWGVDNGIIAGYGDGILGPLGTTTRAQAATIMQRFCQEFCK